MSKFISMGILVLLVLVSMPLQAQGVRALLGEGSVRFTYITEAWGQEIGSLDVEAGVLLAGTNDTNLLHLGVLVQHESQNAELKLSVGGRVYYTSINSNDAALIALGGDLLLIPEQWSGFGVGFSYYTAPSVTTFSDADTFTEYSLSISYQMTPQANIYFGYQKVSIKFTTESNERDIEKGSFIGIRIDF